MSIKKNFIYNALLSFSNLIFPIFTVPYVSRVLGVEAVGIFSFVITVTTYFILIANLGTPLYGIREISIVKLDSSKLNRVFNEIFSINIISAIICTIVFFIFVFNIAQFYQFKQLYIIAGLGIFFSFLNIDWFFSGLEQFRHIALRSMAVKVINLLLLFLLVKGPEDLPIYILLYTISSILNQVWNLFNLRRFNIKLYFTVTNWKKHIKPLFTFLVSAIAIQIYLLLDTIIIGFLRDYQEVGLYSSAIKCVRMVMPIITSLGVALLPKISVLRHDENKDQLYSILNRSFAIVNFISIPLCLFFMLVAPRFVPFFFGDGYEESIKCMQILALLIFISNITYFFSVQILAMMGHEKVYLLAVLFGMLMNISANFLLIPKYGIEGAAVASVVGELSVSMVAMYYVYFKLKFKIRLKTIFITLISSTVLILVYRLLSLFLLSNFQYLMLFSILSFILYFLVQLFIFKNVEILIIISTLKKKIYGNKNSDVSL